MVWEASQKGVPFLGVPGNSLNCVLSLKLQLTKRVTPNFIAKKKETNISSNTFLASLCNLLRIVKCPFSKVGSTGHELNHVVTIHSSRIIQLSYPPPKKKHHSRTTNFIELHLPLPPSRQGATKVAMIGKYSYWFPVKNGT